jgi:hypothetical protein
MGREASQDQRRRHRPDNLLAGTGIPGALRTFAAGPSGFDDAVE